MANGFGSFYVGASGLRSAQNALNTTANNLSNVTTTGYVRQQVRFADMNYVTLQTASSNVNMQQSGLGVSIGDVVHARDIFLDKTYRQEAGRLEFYTVRSETSSYVEDLLQEMDGEEFKECITDFWEAIQEFSTNPATSTYQNLVLEKGELLVSRFSSLYSELQSYQSNLNQQIADEVDLVNEIGNRIYELNLEIQKVEAGGVETAMTLRDERDYLLDQLGAYASIDVTEDSTGFVYVDIEGVAFIDDNKCYNIELKTDKSTGFYTPYWPQLSDTSSGEYVPVFHLTGEYSSEDNTDVGGIKSLLIVRGDGYGTAEDLETEESYSAISTSTVMMIEAQIDLLFNSIVTKMNDIFCPNTELTEDVTVYDENNNAITLSAGTLVLDSENCAVGVDGELPPRELFTRDGCDRYTAYTAEDGSTVYVYNEEVEGDRNTQYVIGNVSINDELSKQVTLMPSYTQNGAVDYDLGAALAAAWEEQDILLSPFDTSTVTITEYYDQLVSDLGTEGSTCASAVSTLEATVNSVDNQRQQVIGVSSDEELTNMIKYQSAYNAASRYITVISEMTELIVTGLI